MERDIQKLKFPTLPNKWEPDTVIAFGNGYVAYYKDAQYHHQFIWDGFSVTFNEHKVVYQYT